MSNGTSKKSRKKSSSASDSAASRFLTQMVCVAIFACVALLGIVQVRRAMSVFGENAVMAESGRTISTREITEEDNQPDERIVTVNTDEETTEFTTTTTVGKTVKSTTGTSKTTTRTSKTTTRTSKSTAKKDAKPTDLTETSEIEITVSPVNVRSGAGSEYERIGRTSKGSRFRYLESKADSDGRLWYRIQYSEKQTGWIMASCGKPIGKDGSASVSSTTASSATASLSAKTSKSAEKTTATTTVTTKSKATSRTASAENERQVRITVSPVNIRAGAGRKYKVISVTKRGEVYTLLSVTRDSDDTEWYEISLDSGTGWIMSRCCAVIGQENKKSSTTGKTTSTTGKKSSTTGKKSSTTGKKSSTTGKTTSTTARKSSTTGKTTSTTAKKSSTTTKTTSKESLLMSIQPKKRDAKYFIVVYKGSQSVVVYGKDKKGDYTSVVKTFSCSTGKSSSPTRTGSYHIRAKYRWRTLVGNVYGQYNSSISPDYLFHSVPYTRNGDPSSLENEEYDKLGTPASKGCIRMCVRDCKWIYDKCEIGTQVQIVNDSGPKGPGVPSRRSAARFSGWDPSDKWADGNPYFS